MFIDNITDLGLLIIIALEPICTIVLWISGSKPKKKPNNMELIRVDGEYIWLDSKKAR